MAQLQIPTVTVDDLLQFQAKHFPGDEPYPAPDYSFVPLDDELAEDDEDFDGLGYYEDGVKRTLTDEQIKIFRHSEIHALLRERRMRQESNDRETSEPREPADSDPSPPSPEPAVSHGVVEKVNSMKRKTDEAEVLSSTAKRSKNTAGVSKHFDVTHGDIQYDEDEDPDRRSRSARPSSNHPSFAGRRIISYDD